MEYFSRTHYSADSPRDRGKNDSSHVHVQRHRLDQEWKFHGMFSNSEMVRACAKRFFGNIGLVSVVGDEDEWYGTHNYKPEG